MEDFTSMKRKELQSLCKKHGIPANLTNLEMAKRLTALFKGKDKKNLENEDITVEKDKVNKRVKSCSKSVENEEVSLVEGKDTKRAKSCSKSMENEDVSVVEGKHKKRAKSCLKSLENEEVSVEGKEGKRVRFSPQDETFEFEKTDPRERRLLARKVRAMGKCRNEDNSILVIGNLKGVEGDMGEKKVGRSLRRKTMVKSGVEGERAVDVGFGEKFEEKFENGNVSGVEEDMGGKNLGRKTRRKTMVRFVNEGEKLVDVGCVEKFEERNLSGVEEDVGVINPGRKSRRKTMVKFVNEDENPVDVGIAGKFEGRNLRRKSMAVLVSENVSSVGMVGEEGNRGRNVRRRSMVKPDVGLVSEGVCNVEKLVAGGNGGRKLRSCGGKIVQKEVEVALLSAPAEKVVKRGKRGGQCVEEGRVDGVVKSDVMVGDTENGIVDTSRKLRSREVKSLNSVKGDDDFIGDSESDNVVGKLPAEKSENVMQVTRRSSRQTAKGKAGNYASVCKEQVEDVVSNQDMGESHLQGLVEMNLNDGKRQRVSKKAKVYVSLSGQMVDNIVPQSNVQVDEGEKEMEDLVNQEVKPTDCSIEKAHDIGTDNISYEDPLSSAVTLDDGLPKNKDSEVEEQYHATGGSIFMEQKNDMCELTSQVAVGSSPHLHMEYEKAKSDQHKELGSAENVHEYSETNMLSSAKNDSPATSMSQGGKNNGDETSRGVQANPDPEVPLEFHAAASSSFEENIVPTPPVISTEEVKCTSEETENCADMTEPICSSIEKPTTPKSSKMITSNSEGSNCEDAEKTPNTVATCLGKLDDELIEQDEGITSGGLRSNLMRETHCKTPEFSGSHISDKFIVDKQSELVLGASSREDVCPLVTVDGLAPVSATPAAAVHKMREESVDTMEITLSLNPEVVSSCNKTEVAMVMEFQNPDVSEVMTEPSIIDISSLFKLSQVEEHNQANGGSIFKEPKEENCEGALQLSASSSPSSHMVYDTDQSEELSEVNDNVQKDPEDVEANAENPANSQVNSPGAALLLQTDGDDETKIHEQTNSKLEIFMKSPIVAVTNSLERVVSTPSSIDTRKDGSPFGSEAAKYFSEASKPICSSKVNSTTPENSKVSTGSKASCDSTFREAKQTSQVSDVQALPQSNDTNENVSEFVSNMNASWLYAHSQDDVELPVSPGSVKQEEVSNKETSKRHLSLFDSCIQLDYLAGNDKSLAVGHLEDDNSFMDSKVMDSDFRDDMTNFDKNKGAVSNKVACVAEDMVAFSDQGEHSVLQLTFAETAPKDNVLLHGDNSMHLAQDQDRGLPKASYPGNIMPSCDANSIVNNDFDGSLTLDSIALEDTPKIPLEHDHICGDLESKFCDVSENFMGEERHQVSQVSGSSFLSTGQKKNQSSENLWDKTITQHSDCMDCVEKEVKSFSCHMEPNEEAEAEGLGDVGCGCSENHNTICSELHEANGEEALTWTRSYVDSVEKEPSTPPTVTIDFMGVEDVGSGANRSPNNKTVGQVDETVEEGISRQNNMLIDVLEEGKDVPDRDQVEYDDRLDIAKECWTAASDEGAGNIADDCFVECAIAIEFGSESPRNRSEDVGSDAQNSDFVNVDNGNSKNFEATMEFSGDIALNDDSVDPEADEDMHVKYDSKQALVEREVDSLPASPMLNSTHLEAVSVTDRKSNSRSVLVYAKTEDACTAKDDHPCINMPENIEEFSGALEDRQAGSPKEDHPFINIAENIEEFSRSSDDRQVESPKDDHPFINIAENIEEFSRISEDREIDSAIDDHPFINIAENVVGFSRASEDRQVDSAKDGHSFVNMAENLEEFSRDFEDRQVGSPKDDHPFISIVENIDEFSRASEDKLVNSAKDDHPSFNVSENIEKFSGVSACSQVSLAKDDFPFITKFEIKEEFSGASEDKVNMTELSLGQNFCTSILGAVEHGDDVGSEECGETCHMQVKHISAPSEMEVEQLLEGRDNNDDLGNKAGSILSWSHGFEDFTDQFQEQMSSPLMSSYHQMNSPGLTSGASASITSLHDSEENKNQKCHSESRMLSSGDADFPWEETSFMKSENEAAYTHDKLVIVHQHDKLVEGEVISVNSCKEAIDCEHEILNKTNTNVGRSDCPLEINDTDEAADGIKDSGAHVTNVYEVGGVVKGSDELDTTENKVVEGVNDLDEHERDSVENKVSEDAKDQDVQDTPENEVAEGVEDSDGHVTSENKEAADRVQLDTTENEVVKFSSMIKRENKRRILIHGTPKKQNLYTNDMKENPPAIKSLQMLNATALKPMVKRKALQDLRK